MLSGMIRDGYPRLNTNCGGSLNGSGIRDTARVLGISPATGLQSSFFDNIHANIVNLNYKGYFCLLT